MNRSFTNVLFGAFGQVQQAAAGGEAREYKAESVEGASQVLEQANLPNVQTITDALRRLAEY